MKISDIDILKYCDTLSGYYSKIFMLNINLHPVYIEHKLVIIKLL